MSLRGPQPPVGPYGLPKTTTTKSQAPAPAFAVVNNQPEKVVTRLTPLSLLSQSSVCVVCVHIHTSKTDTRLRNRGRHIHTRMNDMNMKDAANKDDGLSNDKQQQQQQQQQQQRSLDEYLEIAYDS